MRNCSYSDFVVESLQNMAWLEQEGEGRKGQAD